MNQLELRYAITDDRITLRPHVDGVDILELYRDLQGLDPDRLLPPLSSALLPTRAGRRAIIGACSCGDVGCGALSASVRRDGGEVRWEPSAAPHRQNLARIYRFELRQYLDAVDEAAASPPPGEGSGRRVARMVGVLRRDEDEAFGSHHWGTTVDWVHGWPWTGDVVSAAISTREGQQLREFAARPGEPDQAFAARVADVVQHLQYQLR